METVTVTEYHPFRPVVLIPPTRNLFPKKYRNIGGRIISVAAAMIDGQLITNELPDVYI